MRKNQDDDALKKAGKNAQKTGSEKKEPAKQNKATTKKGPDLNKPLFDVVIDSNGAADVISEQAIDEINYPPEFAAFIGDMLVELRAQLGLREDELIPQEVLDEFFAKLLSNTTPEQILDAIADNEPDDEGDEEESEDDDDDEDGEEEITDEMLANIDYSQLDTDEFGNRILCECVLCYPEGEEPKGIIERNIPVEIDPEAVKNHVVIKALIPYIEKFSIEEVNRHPEDFQQDGFFLFDTFDKEFTYQIHGETLDEMKKLLERAGCLMPERHEDGYVEETKEYWFDTEVYHEGDVIWLEMPRPVSTLGGLKGFSANIDNFNPLYSPCDISKAKSIKIENGQRVLSKEESLDIYIYGRNEEWFKTLMPHEMIWHLACECAKTKDTPGYCIVCLNGKFNVPVESFLNPVTLESEDLVVIFNAIGCFPIHHKCAGLIIVDIGNIQIHTGVRYCNGMVFDWAKRVDQEIKAYQFEDADFDPYDDPYDNPRNAIP